MIYNKYNIYNKYMIYEKQLSLPLVYDWSSGNFVELYFVKKM